MPEPSVHDLFVSYAEADQAWVEGYLLDALTAAELSVHSEAAFELGQPRLVAFERAVTQSRRILLVVSSAYLADETVGFVDLLAQTYGLEVGTWPVIPLVIEQVDLPPRLALLHGLDATDPSERNEVIARLCAELGRPTPPPLAPPECPYPGMRPFTERDAPAFFGRDDEIAHLLQSFHTQRDRTSRFLAVIGPSGSGKSSLVFAGLIPAMRRSTLLGDGPWTMLSMRPGPRPMETPTVVLGDETGGLGPLPDDLVAAPPAGRLLLVVDQFEELFTMSAPEQAAPLQAVISGLAAMPHCYVVLTARADFYPDLMATELWPLIESHRVEVLPLGEEGLREAIVKPAERVGVYVESALVERLASDAAGEPGVLPLVQQTLVLLWDRLERRYLPLWAYEALVLPRSAYDTPTEGQVPRTGLQVAVARHADAALAELSPAQQTIARRVFLNLIQPNEGRGDTRRQRVLDDLRSVDDDPSQFAQVVQHLAANRLLTLSGAEEGPRRVDLAHEALISGWPWLHDLASTHREAAQIKDRLDRKIAEWERLGTKGGGLLDAVELAEAEQWLAGPDAHVLGYSPSLPKLVEESREELGREVRRLRNRLYGAVAFAALALMAAIVAGFFYQRADSATQEAKDNLNLAETRAVEAANAAGTAESERHNAEVQATLASTAREEAEHQAQVNLVQSLAVQSQLEKNLGDDERSALLARQAYLFDEGGDARGEVGTAMQSTVGSPFYSTRSAADPSAVGSIAFSSDGETMVVARDDGSVDVVSPTGSIACEDEENRPLRTIAAALNRDGSVLATASGDGTVHLWDVDADGCTHRDSLAGPGGRVFTVAYIDASPEPRLAAGSCETDPAVPPEAFVRASECRVGSATVRLWSLGDASAVVEDYRIAGTRVCALAASPDGRYLAASGCGDAGDDGDAAQCAEEPGTIALWDVQGGGEEAECLAGHTGEVWSLALDACNHMVSGGEDRRVGFWSLGDGAPPRLIGGHDEEVTGVALSGDCSFLASASRDGSVGLWHVDAPDPVIRVIGVNPQWVRTVAFGGPDGLRLVADGYNGTMRFWELGRNEQLAPGILRGHTEYIRSLAFSPDEGTHILASAAEDGTIRIWNLDEPASEPVLPGFGPSEPPAFMTQVAFNHDGTLLAGSDDAGRVWVWAVSDPAEPVVSFPQFAAKADVILAFHPSRNQLVAGTASGYLHLLDAESGATVGEPVALTEGRAITALAFSPDGARLLVGNDEGTIAVVPWATDGLGGASDTWDGGHGGKVLTVAFSPDSSLLASGGEDGEIHLWDGARRFDRPVALEGHADEIRSLVFSSDGGSLISGSVDQTIRIWDPRRPGDTPVVIVGVNEWIRALAISPDGTVLAAPDTQAAIRLIVPETSMLADRVCERVTMNLTPNQWRRYVGVDVPYQRTCPNYPMGPDVSSSAPLARVEGQTS